MKTAEKKQSQTVTGGEKVIPQNTDHASKLLASEKPAETKVKTSGKPKKEPKAKKERALSMEKLGDQLIASKATEAECESAFIAAYKLKGEYEDTFVKARTKIYMKIATARAAVAAVVATNNPSK